jgi:hypothetical protein
MVITTQQLTELHKMSLLDLKAQHKKLKSHTKKASNKEDIIKQIDMILTEFNTFRTDISKKYKCNIRPHKVKSYDNFTSVDLRQVHTSIRQALQCKKHTKEIIINSFIRLCKILDYLIQF